MPCVSGLNMLLSCLAMSHLGSSLLLRCTVALLVMLRAMSQVHHNAEGLFRLTDASCLRFGYVTVMSCHVISWKQSVVALP